LNLKYAGNNISGKWLSRQVFDANGGVGGTDNGVAEDTRLYGYDPMIPPALIQEEIPQVNPPYSILCRQLTLF
jgi:hypothetical protein